MDVNRIHRLLSWPAALYIAGILLWYGQCEPTGNPGPVWLFTVITDWLFLDGYEEKPFRLFVATMEIAATVLVVLPSTRMAGAALALCVMSGAIFFHVASPLGIDPHKDGAALFKEAIGAWPCAAFVLFSYRLFSYRQAILAMAKTLVPRISRAST